MNDVKQFNEILDDVRGHKMPRHPVEQLFNLTFKHERQILAPDKAGGSLEKWESKKDLKGALDEFPDVLPDEATHALYCSADEDVKSGDKITLEGKNGRTDATLRVLDVINPMMQNKYLILYVKHLGRRP
jgi:hypothetical protein